MLKIVIAASLSVFLSACGGGIANQQAALQQASNAGGKTVVIYRGPSFQSGAIKAGYNVNGIRANTFTLGAGKTGSFSINKGPNLVTSFLQPFGAMYYWPEGYEDRPTFLVHQPTAGMAYFYEVPKQIFRQMVEGTISAKDYYVNNKNEINAQKYFGKLAFSQMVLDRKRAALESKCLGFGFKKGTSDFANCLMQQEIAQSQQEEIEKLKRQVANATREAEEAKNEAKSAKWDALWNKVQSDRKISDANRR
jgi:hypothetical protein